jgi:hypothetical protein
MQRSSHFGVSQSLERGRFPPSKRWDDPRDPRGLLEFFLKTIQHDFPQNHWLTLFETPKAIGIGPQNRINSCDHYDIKRVLVGRLVAIAQVLCYVVVASYFSKSLY